MDINNLRLSLSHFKTPHGPYAHLMTQTNNLQMIVHFASLNNHILHHQPVISPMNSINTANVAAQLGIGDAKAAKLFTAFS